MDIKIIKFARENLNVITQMKILSDSYPCISFSPKQRPGQLFLIISILLLR